MLTKTLLLFSMILGVAVFFACEGDQGPAGPNPLLAYADLDIGPSSHTVLSSGPPGAAVSDVTITSVGIYTITFTGSFPGTRGTLLATPTSAAGVNNTVVYGDINSWSTTQIVITIRIKGLRSGEYEQDDFSVAIVGM